ncbi:hypothetical protein MACH17_06110 [Phaeobacter inhibens]|uniref:tetratricopeptide repeat protein n=1 Tax=Phaeobacter inhibens TaxID=221822 RepID=UPI00276E23F8|nr:tetratricopeptide repeat protein [Phaeobacter inhibens]GLO69094.1 hypothetical protein MACH17_06110 [Phaeobacter inhibens]
MNWIRISATLALLGVAQLTRAQECPDIPDNTGTLNQLLSELRAAPNEMQGRNLNNQIWAIWATAPDAIAQDLLDKGRERIRVADYAKAIEQFTKLTAYCPHYAEGWNQRGFAHYLRQDYGAALDDIAEALQRNPRHYGALVGRATVLISMGRTEVGHTELRNALKLNPWLSERFLLPVGEDL